MIGAGSGRTEVGCTSISIIAFRRVIIIIISHCDPIAFGPDYDLYETAAARTGSVIDSVKPETERRGRTNLFFFFKFFFLPKTSLYRVRDVRSVTFTGVLWRTSSSNTYVNGSVSSQPRKPYMKNIMQWGAYLWILSREMDMKNKYFVLVKYSIFQYPSFGVLKNMIWI